MTSRSVVVGSLDSPRVDAFVRAHLAAASRRVVEHLIRTGLVRVNGRRVAKGARLVPGDRVEFPEVIVPSPAPELSPAVLYVDDDLLVLDKPGGVPGHALDPQQAGTIAGWIADRWPNAARVGDPLSSGLVHRLDTGTSGALIAARTTAAHAALRRAFRDRRVEKRYVAIVAGDVPTRLEIDQPLAHDPSDPRRMRPARAGDRAWRATSIVRRRRSGSGASLVEVAIRTGVTHQIRVHLASHGHPVLGDAIYGCPDDRLPPQRHALHAARIVMPHPTREAPVEVHAPWPADLAQLWDALSPSRGETDSAPADDDGDL